MTSELNKVGLEAARESWPKTWEPYNLGAALETAIRAYLSASHQPAQPEEAPTPRDRGKRIKPKPGAPAGGYPSAQPAEAEGLEVVAWPLAGYAPGSYMCLCATCGEHFMGDKRAVQCLTCAARSVNARITDAGRAALRERE